MKNLIYYSKFILLALLIMLTLISGAVSTSVATVGDAMFEMFAGGSQVTFQLKHFLAYFFTYILFVYLVQISLQKTLNNTGYYQLIRYKSTNKWIYHWFKKISIGSSLYLLALFIVAIGIAFFFTRNISFSITVSNTVNFYHITYHFFINGFLQLSVYILLVFILSWWKKEVFHSLVGIIIVLMFMFPNTNSSLFIPSGLNSMFYILGSHSMYYITLVLIIWNVIGVLVVKNLLNKDLKI